MTLHEAIEQVLQNAEKPLFSRDIADIINSQKLYKRKDFTADHLRTVNKYIENGLIKAYASKPINIELVK